MKTKEELNALKAEVETLNKKLAELNEEGLKMVSGGFVRGFEYQELDQSSGPKLWGEFILPSNGDEDPLLHIDLAH